MNQPRMITRQKIQPSYTFSVRSKYEIPGKLTYHTGCFCRSFGTNMQNILSSMSGDRIVVYTAEKIRAKFAQKKKINEKTGRSVTKSFKIREGRWDVRVYTFDKKAVVSAVQMDRTFRIVLK